MPMGKYSRLNCVRSDEAITEDPAITKVWAALSRIPDPCHALSGYDLSIVDLGLINEITRKCETITVSVTFTDPSCVFSYKIIMELEDLAASLKGVQKIVVVSDPYPLWTEDRLSPKAKDLFASKREKYSIHRRASPKGDDR